MESWKKILPNYKIIRWDESSFPINEHPYAGQSYEAKKWAFVSDYVRVWVLFNYGGIYLDTDYELIETVDGYLNYDAFMGVENSEYIGIAIMGAQKGNWLMGEMLNYYNAHSFTLKNDKFDMIPNTMILTDIMCANSYLRGEATLQNGIYVGDRVEFYPVGKQGV